MMSAGLVSGRTDRVVALALARNVPRPTWRMTRPSFGAPCVLEAEAGAFDRWGLHEGDQLEIKK